MRDYKSSTTEDVIIIVEKAMEVIKPHNNSLFLEKTFIWSVLNLWFITELKQEIIEEIVDMEKNHYCL